MREDKDSYEELIASLEEINSYLRNVMQDQNSSNWVKQSILGLWRRDIEESFHDVEKLKDFLSIRKKADRLLMENKITRKK